MVDGFLTMVPTAKVGHIGLYRDPETLEPVKYYCKMPMDIQERDVFIVDPMLATGGSATAAIEFIKEYGCTSINLMNIIAAPEGIIQMLTFLWLLWMKSSMTTAISCPVWAMPVTEFSAQSDSH